MKSWPWPETRAARGWRMQASQAVASAKLDSAAEEAARTLGVEALRAFMLDDVPCLEGTVPSFRHKKAAAEMVIRLTGAPHVVNRLRVAPREDLSDRAIHEGLQALNSLAVAGAAEPAPSPQPEEEARVLAS